MCQEQRQEDSNLSCQLKHIRFLPHKAVGVGFEPTIPFPIYSLSRTAVSTTHAPHRFKRDCCLYLKFLLKRIKFQTNREQANALDPCPPLAELCDASKNGVRARLRQTTTHQISQSYFYQFFWPYTTPYPPR